MRSIRPECGAWRRAFVPILVLAAAVLALLPAVALAADPINWSVTESKYGATPGTAPDTSFQTPLSSMPTVGMTAGANKAYGMGIWQATRSVYVFGFANSPNMTMATSMANTDLAGKDIGAGTQLELRFTKSAGQKIGYFAIVCNSDARVAVEPEAGKTLTEASYFIVRATIVRPVKSAGGEPVGGAFGFIASLSPAQDYMGAIFATNMHWIDIQPPTFTATGMAGLNAAGANGTMATFDGIFAQALLDQMGITEPLNVEGYIDLAQILPGSTVATFTVPGLGDGSLWTSGWYKYRITNSGWSTHSIMYGRVSKPAKPMPKSPKGVIATRKPTFKWAKSVGATKYEVAVYKGAKKLTGKTGLTVASWKCGKALPKGVWLKWKVRASNAAGTSAWTSVKIKIK